MLRSVDKCRKRKIAERDAVPLFLFLDGGTPGEREKVFGWRVNSIRFFSCSAFAQFGLHNARAYANILFHGSWYAKDVMYVCLWTYMYFTNTWNRSRSSWESLRTKKNVYTCILDKRERVSPYRLISHLRSRSSFTLYPVQYLHIHRIRLHTCIKCLWSITYKFKRVLCPEAPAKH